MTGSLKAALEDDMEVDAIGVVVVVDMEADAMGAVVDLVGLSAAA